MLRRRTTSSFVYLSTWSPRPPAVVELDSSAQAYLVQVSVPVMDGDAAIGAITIGIDLDRLEPSGQ